MLKTEFCYLIDCETKALPEDDYGVIEFVYNNYPKNLNKSDIATLYQVGGIARLDDEHAKLATGRD